MHWIRSRDILLFVATALFMFGTGFVATLNPSWHRVMFGGFEVGLAALGALAFGVLGAGIAAAPPTRWAVFEGSIRKISMLVFPLAVITMFGFRLIRGMSLDPYGYGGCYHHTASHVAVLSAFVFPIAALNIGVSIASLIGSIWDKSPGRSLVMRAVSTALASGGVAALVLGAMSSSVWLALFAWAGLAAAPLLRGKWFAAAVSIVGLGTSMLFAYYL